MKKNMVNRFKLGIFVIASLTALIVGVYLLGRNNNMFRSNITLYAFFKDVKGLQSGNNVRFSGITIGVITDIEIENDSMMMVEMSISEKASRFVKVDSKAMIDNEGIMGSKIVQISNGSSDAPSVQDEDVLQAVNTVNIEDIMEEVKKTAIKADEIMNNLLEVSQKLNSSTGDLGALITQKTIVPDLRKASEDLVDITADIKVMVGQANSMDSDIGRLIYDTQISDNLTEASTRFNKVAGNAENITSNLEKTTRAINEGEGLISRLVYDTILAKNFDTTLVRLNTGIIEVTETAQTIDNSWLLNLFSNDSKDARKSRKGKD